MSGRRHGPSECRGSVLVANAGTLHVFRTAEQLLRAGLLRRCATTLFLRNKTAEWFPPPLRSRVLRATVNRRSRALDGCVETFMWPELAHLAARRLRLGAPDKWIEWRNRRFCAWAADQCLDGVEAVWGFDTSSYELFVAAKKRGIRSVLEMTIAHPQRGIAIMTAYAQKRPALARYLDLAIADEQLARRDKEIELADLIATGSSFVRDSLIDRGVPEAKIAVNPYGVDLDTFRACVRTRAAGEPVRFLFVGWFSVRKGMYDLLEAWRRSKLADAGAELVLAGGAAGDLPFWPGPVEGIRFGGRVPHSDLPAWYADADVFVFPSLFEGSARVVAEAIASGLPVITTPEACEAGNVIDGENGFRVRAGDPAALADRMRSLMDPALRQRMGAASAARAQLYSWNAYGDRCVAAYNRLIASERV